MLLPLLVGGIGLARTFYAPKRKTIRTIDKVFHASSYRYSKMVFSNLSNNNRGNTSLVPGQPDTHCTGHQSRDTPGHSCNISVDICVSPSMAGSAGLNSKNFNKKRDIDGLEGKVWVSDGAGAFIQGRIVELSEEGPIVQPFDPDHRCITAGYDQVYPAEEDDNKDVDDNCSLMYLNEATLLNNVRIRNRVNKGVMICFLSQ